MDMNSTPVAGYTQHSCMGGCVGGGDITETADGIPTLQDIAGYSTMQPQQQEQQRQQLQQANHNAFGGMPFQSSFRWAASNAPQANAPQAYAPQTNISQANVTQTMPAAKGKQMMTAAQAAQMVQGVQSASVAGVPGTQMVQGTSSAPLIPGQPVPLTPTTQPMPISGESLQYLNGFLRTQIGRAVQVEFLIGTNTLVDRTGTLLGVGANYILINEAETDDLVACDFYNIKFVKFYY